MVEPREPKTMFALLERRFYAARRLGKKRARTLALAVCMLLWGRVCERAARRWVATCYLLGMFPLPSPWANRRALNRSLFPTGESADTRFAKIGSLSGNYCNFLYTNCGQRFFLLKLLNFYRENGSLVFDG